MVKVRVGLASVGRSGTGSRSNRSEADQSIARPVAASRDCQYQPESGREKLPPVSPSTTLLVDLALRVRGGDQGQQEGVQPRVEVALDCLCELDDEYGARH
jgi:hypothetical protein